MRKIILLHWVLLLTFSCFGQVSVLIKDMSNANTGAPIGSGGPIAISYGGSIRITFTVEMSKSSSQVVDGNLYVYTKQTSGSSAQTRSGPLYIVNTMWNGGNPVYYYSSQDITLYASEFNASGGTLYAQFESTTGVNYKSSNWTVTVNAPPIANNSISGNQTIQIGSTASTITGSTPSGGSGSYTYSWQRKIGSDSWGTISGAAGKDYAPGALTTTTSYRRVVASGTATSSTSNEVTVTVVDVPITNNSITASQTIDAGTAPAKLIGSTPSGGNGTYTYQWQAKAGSWYNITGATSKDYSPGVMNANLSFRRLVNSGSASVSPSNEVSITVLHYPPVTNNWIAFDGVSQVTGSTPVGGSGSYLYSYYVVADQDNGLEYATDFTTNKDFTVPGFFLSLMNQSISVWISRTVRTASKNYETDYIKLEPGVQDITNNTITFDGVSFVTGSTPTGGNGTYTYSWQFVDNATGEPTYMTGQTGINLNVPSLFTGSVDLNVYVRRIVTSGTKTSNSDWISVLATTAGSGRSASSVASEVSAESSRQETLTAYPNPTREKISFDIVASGRVKVVVYDTQQRGIEVFNGNVDGRRSVEWTIPANFNKGIYYYQISDQAKIVNTGRFVYE